MGSAQNRRNRTATGPCAAGEIVGAAGLGVAARDPSEGLPAAPLVRTTPTIGACAAKGGAVTGAAAGAPRVPSSSWPPMPASGGST